LFAKRQQTTFHNSQKERDRHSGGLNAHENVQLLRDTIDGVAAKCRVFVADLTVCSQFQEMGYYGILSAEGKQLEAEHLKRSNAA
jgi:hypothetical protein